MAVRNIPLAAAGERVSDVMLSAPRTVPASATVAELRPMLENPRVRMLLVADGEAFVGSVRSEALLDHPEPAAPVGDLVDRAAPRVRPSDAVEHALSLLDGEPSERLPVVDDAGRLTGLVCFNRRKGHFCVDA